MSDFSLVGKLESDLFPFSLVICIGSFVPDAIYDELVEVCGDNAPPVDREWMHTKGREIEDRGAGGYHHELAKNISLIWLSNNTEWGFISHEASHATHHLLTEIGIFHTCETDEVYAYVLGWIVGSIQKGVDDFWENERALENP
jgi:hypothetical protein